MGLFSTEYRTVVGTTVSRVIKDDALPNSSHSGLVKSVIQGTEVSETIVEELGNSVGIRAERMYAYAEQHYTNGLPSGDIFSSTQGTPEVETVLEAIEQQQIVIEYNHFGPANVLHMAYMKLVSTYGYNEATNILESISPNPLRSAYLKSIRIVVPKSLQSIINPFVLEQWSTPAESRYVPGRIVDPNNANLYNHPIVGYSDKITKIQAQVTYSRKTSIDFIQDETINIDIPEYVAGADYFHVKYYVNNQPKYWIYQAKSGVYPLLDAVYTEKPFESGNYFPFAYFRYGKQSSTADTTTDEYKTTKKMLKYLGMDYEQLAQGINENPDIADVEQAMLVLAVPAVSTNAIENQYLFDYFNNLHIVSGGGVDINSAIAQSSLTNIRLTSHSYVIQDAKFKMAFQNEGVYKKIVTGNIGAIGTCTSGFFTRSITVTSLDMETSLNQNTVRNVGVHTYKKQINAGMYEEISVYELRMVYYVYGDYTVTADDTDNILLVPIDRSISSNYSIGIREELYSRSLHFVFNSRVIQKIKWYQQEWFSVFLMVIAIIITIVNYGADGGSAIATALGLTGTAGLIATIIVTMAVGQLLPKLYSLAVKLVGSDAAKIFAIAMIIYAGYKVIEAGGLKGAPWAKQMLQVSNGLINAALKADFNDLLNEKSELGKWIEEQTKLLDEARKELEGTSKLDPLVVIGEKPEDFYNRTIHSGNIGVLGINAISSYVDMALTLPKIHDTLGEISYGNTV